MDPKPSALTTTQCLRQSGKKQGDFIEKQTDASKQGDLAVVPKGFRVQGLGFGA